MNEQDTMKEHDVMTDDLGDDVMTDYEDDDDFMVHAKPHYLEKPYELDPFVIPKDSGEKIHATVTIDISGKAPAGHDDGINDNEDDSDFSDVHAFVKSLPPELQEKAKEGPIKISF